MSSIKGTNTEQNLLKAFAGESQARTRYTFFASVAKKQGHEQISAIFMETAEQEKEHAKKFFKFLEGGMVEITASYPAGVIGTTAENLKAAAEGENEEWVDLYPEFAKIADEIGTVFSDSEEIEWQCRNCGYVFRGKKAPEVCPACAHPQAFFERKKNNY